MSRFSLLFLLALAVVAVLFFSFNFNAGNNNSVLQKENGDDFKLPEPDLAGRLSLEEAIYQRVSRRSFTSESLALEELSQILWAGQGIGIDGVTGASRTAPSAGATHPMHIMVIAGNVEDLPAGVYIYDFAKHNLNLIVEGDYRDELAAAALSQDFIADAPAALVLTASYERTTDRYGERGIRYVHIETGHITQNVCLQAEALGLGSVAIGAFEDLSLQKLLQIEADPLMIIPVGNI